jgi:hypothetical protein
MQGGGLLASFVKNTGKYEVVRVVPLMPGNAKSCVLMRVLGVKRLSPSEPPIQTAGTNRSTRRFARLCNLACCA